MKPKTHLWIISTVLIFLTAAYVYGLSTQLSLMLDKPVRMSYFIADVLVIFPIGILCIWAIWQKKNNSNYYILCFIGALLFDMVHQTVYLFFDNYFEINLAIPIVMSVLIFGYLVMAMMSLTNK